MGLLNVFKRKQASSEFKFPDDDLELPPPPPSSDNFAFNTDEPESSLPDSSELPDLDNGFSELESNGSTAAFPELPDLEHDFNDDKTEEPIKESPVIVPAPKIPAQTLGAKVVHPAPKRSTFIKIDEFREVLSAHQTANSKTNSLSDSMMSISRMCHEEDLEFEKWHKHANIILKKLSYVDKVLFEHSMNQ